MVGKAGVKAGLIGAAILFVVTLLNALVSLVDVPALSCLCCGLPFLAYAGIGVLAGSFLSAPRSAGSGAGAGAVAGLVSGVVAGVVQTIVMAVRMATTGVGQMVSAVDPQLVQPLIDAGIDPRSLATFTGWGGVAIGGTLCCAASLAIGAVLGAIGGAIFAAAKSD
jgi:hypothetical protein